MNNWYKIKVTYDKEINQEGMMKRVSEAYLLDAVSFTDAEARINKILEPRGSFTIGDISRVRLAETFLNNTGERFYIAKVGFISLDEKAGIEKKTYVQMLVQADDIQEALDGINNGMKGTLADYDISAIKETNIVDVFPADNNAQ